MVFILLLDEIVKVVVNNFTAHMNRVRQLLEAKLLVGNLKLYQQESSLHIVQVNNKSPFIFKLVLCKVHIPRKTNLTILNKPKNQRIFCVDFCPKGQIIL